MALRLSLRLDGVTTTDELIELGRQAEAAGFDRIWASEGELSPFASLALLAGHCRRLGLATGVARAFARSPLDTALNTLDLARYTEGRFVLGLGIGSRQTVESGHGMACSRPPARLREYLQLVRHLLRALPRGEPVEHEGEFYRVRYRGRRPQLSSGSQFHAPIHIGTHGPMVTRVAGELADGLLTHVLGSPLSLQDVIWPAVDRGLQASGRQRADFELTATVVCAISSDRARARWDVARVLAIYGAAPSNASVLARHGFGDLAGQLQVTPPDKAPALIPDEMIDCFCAAGSPDQARQMVRQFEGLATGVRLLPPPYVLSAEEAWAYQQTIIETFGQ